VAARPSTRHRRWRRVDPRAAARNSKQQVRLEQLPSLFLFLAGGDNTVSCKTIKTQHRQVILVFISFVFSNLLRFLPFFKNLSRFSASSADRSSSYSFGGRSAVGDPASWVRRRRRCYGKETSLQGWRSLLLETVRRLRKERPTG